MNLFLHIIISEVTPQVNFHLYSQLKNHEPKINYYSVDNHSEPVVVEAGLKALDESEKVFIFIECDHAEPGKTFRLIKQAAKIKSNIELKILCNGRNEKLELLSRLFSNRWSDNAEDKPEELAKSFFKDPT